MLKPLHIISGILAGLVIVGGLMFALSSQTKEGESLPLLFPDLHNDINKVDQILLIQSGKTTTLKRQEGAWFVSGYDGIPAQFSTIRRTLLALADTRIVEEKTKNSKHYPSLGVIDPKDKTSRAQGIVLYAQNQPIVSLVMGKEESLLSGASKPDLYIRLQDTVYWTRGALAFPTEGKAYLDPVLWTLDASRVQAIAWQAPTYQGSVKRTTPFDTTWQDLSGTPLGKRDDVLRASILAQWSDSLSFSDIRPADSFASQTPAFTVTITTFDGFGATLTGYQDEQKQSVWVIIQATPQQAKATNVWQSQKPKTFTGAVDLQPHDVVMSDIVELQAKAKGRAFQIPSYPAEFLLPKPEKTGDDAPLPTQKTKN